MKGQISVKIPDEASALEEFLSIMEMNITSFVKQAIREKLAREVGTELFKTKKQGYLNRKIIARKELEELDSLAKCE